MTDPQDAVDHRRIVEFARRMEQQEIDRKIRELHGLRRAEREDEIQRVRDINAHIPAKHPIRLII